MGKKGDNFSVYGSFKWMDAIKEYAKKHNMKVSKAIVELSQAQLDYLNRDKNDVIHKFDERQSKK